MTIGRPGAPLRLLAVAATGVAATLVIPATAPAEGTARYSGVASGDGLRVQFRVPGFFAVEDFVDAGAPTAQASLDSVGGSHAFASAPYPGQTVLTGPGTFAIATGIQLPAQYPWYAASAHPATPKSTVDQGPVHLESRSDDQASSAAARLGTPEGSGRATSAASVTRSADGTVTASAETLADLVTVGPVSVKGLVSRAAVVRKPDQDPQRTSSLQAAAITIADTPVTLGPEGLILAGTTIPAPTIPGIREALAQAQVSIETVQVTPTDDGVVAPGLRITTTQPIPGAGVPGTLTYTLGQASAAVTVDALGPVGPDAGFGDGSGADGFGVPGPGTGSAPGGAADPDSPAGRGAVGGSPAGCAAGRSPDECASGAGCGTGTGSGDAGNGEAGSGAAGQANAAPIALGTLQSASPVSMWSLFPVLLVAGVLLALGAHAQHLLKVRKSWSS